MQFAVFRALAAIGAYLFMSFPTVLRIVWLPAAVALVANILAVPFGLDAAIVAAGASTADPSVAADRSAASALLVTALNAVAGLAYLMMVVGVMRHLVRGDAPKGPFYLFVGVDDIRVIATFIVAILVIGVVYVGGVLVAAIATAAIGFVAAALGVGDAALFVLLPVALLAVFGVVLWASARVYVAAPAAVAERGIGVGSSWRLTKGAVFPLSAYLLITGVASFALVLGAQIIAVPELLGFIRGVAAALPDESAVLEAQSKLAQSVRPRWDAANPQNYPFFASIYVANVISALTAAVPASVAYKLLVSAQDRQTADV